MGLFRPLLAAALLSAVLAPVVRADQSATSESPAPTAVERALVDLRCDAIPLARVPGTAVRNDCQRAQLAEIRGDFGRDLGRLSVRDRRKLDATCGPLLTPRSREAYVECLDGELTSFKNSRRAQGAQQEPAKDATASAGAVAPATTTAAPVAPAAVDASQSGEPAGQRVGGAAEAGGWQGVIWSVVAVIFVATAGLGAVLKFRKPAPAAIRPVCKTCGSDVPDGGDLCQLCRHQAVEALKHAAERRAAEVRDAARRIEAEADRAVQAAQEPDRVAAALAAQAVQAAQADAPGQSDQLGLPGQPSQPGQPGQGGQLGQPGQQDVQMLVLVTNSVEQTWPGPEEQKTGDTAADPSDPYVVLGVSPGATQADVSAAYAAALARYDASLAADFGLEVQKHFEAKRSAIARAYAELAQPVDA